MPGAHSPAGAAGKELPTSPGQHHQPELSKSPSPTQDAQFSVPALHLLAEVLAPLLDIVFGNDEKDRVIVIGVMKLLCLKSPGPVFDSNKSYMRRIDLCSIWFFFSGRQFTLQHHVLRLSISEESHFEQCAFFSSLLSGIQSSFRSWSKIRFDQAHWRLNPLLHKPWLWIIPFVIQLLASLSSYAYVRRAWKKEAFDLLMDPQFFQMDLVCIGYWRTIIDHLMSYERVVFKDLMTRYHSRRSCLPNEHFAIHISTHYGSERPENGPSTTSVASERANGRASGPLLIFRLIAVRSHRATG